MNFSVLYWIAVSNDLRLRFLSHCTVGGLLVVTMCIAMILTLGRCDDFFFNMGGPDEVI